ncbi:hypothetical protein [Streptomyces sp. CO7]
MSFEDEWAQLKEDALRRANTGMNLAGVEPAMPAPRGTGGVDLGLIDSPLRATATNLRETRDNGQEQTKLYDAEAVGKAHGDWDAGVANDQCVRAWQSRLHELGDMVEDATAALTKAMDSQISDDGSVAVQLEKAADWLEGA